MTIDPDNIFPSPQDIVELDPEDFRKTLGAGYRAPYLLQLANDRTQDGLRERC